MKELNKNNKKIEKVNKRTVFILEKSKISYMIEFDKTKNRGIIIRKNTMLSITFEIMEF